jgi:hypothetical protein
MLAIGMCFLVEARFLAVERLFRPELSRDYSADVYTVFSQYTDHLDAFDRAHFCDFIHHSAPGHRLLADCISDVLVASEMSPEFWRGRKKQLTSTASDSSTQKHASKDTVGTTTLDSPREGPLTEGLRRALGAAPTPDAVLATRRASALATPAWDPTGTLRA